MKTRHTLALATGAASALALIPVGQAAAHEAAHETVQVKAADATHHASTRALLASLSTMPLDQLDAWATTLQTAAAAVPDGRVLTGRARLLAKRQLRAAVITSRRLGALDGLTAAQQARVDVITSRLSAAAASLRALLANTPPATTRAAVPVTVVPTSSTKAVRANDARARVCDGDHAALLGTRFAGFRDGARTADRRWDGRHHR